jgi:hypothetical protein
MAKETVNNKLATQPKGGAAVAKAGDVVVPDFLKQHVGVQSGFEESDREDFVLPRLAICQSLTPQKKKSNPNYIAGLEDGDLFNTVTGKIYAKEGEELKLVPLFFTKQRIFFKEPIGSGIDCQSINGKTGGRLSPASCRQCKNSQFGSASKGEGPACTEFKNIVVLIEGDRSPVIFSTKSSMIKVTKQWLSMMQMLNMPMFARVYAIKTGETTSNSNTYFTYSQKPLEFVPEEAFLKAKTFFESMHDKSVTFNPEDLESDDVEHGEGDEGAAY